MGKIKLEVHLMVQEPEEVLTNWLRVADRVFVHQETLAEGAEKIFSQCQVARAHQLALALFLDTPLDVVEDYLPYIDSLLLLAVARPGFYGESLSEDFYARLTEAQGRWPQLSLVVDGGVKLSNAGQLVGAGADRLVVGSGLWQSGQELATTYQQFQTIVSAVGNF